MKVLHNQSSSRRRVTFKEQHCSGPHPFSELRCKIIETAVEGTNQNSGGLTVALIKKKSSKLCISHRMYCVRVTLPSYNTCLWENAQLWWLFNNQKNFQLPDFQFILSTMLEEFIAIILTKFLDDPYRYEYLYSIISHWVCDSNLQDCSMFIDEAKHNLEASLLGWLLCNEVKSVAHQQLSCSV